MTNSTDTQRNVHLTEHHILDTKPLHGNQDLHHTRLDRIMNSNTESLQRQMPLTRLAQLRVTRFVIRKMRPFSECEDAIYHEQSVPSAPFSNSLISQLFISMMISGQAKSSTKSFWRCVSFGKQTPNCKQNCQQSRCTRPQKWRVSRHVSG